MPEIWTEGINKEAGIFEIKFIKLTSDESLRMVFQEYKKNSLRFSMVRRLNDA
ncbi:hypothetical protein EC2720900_5326 [Escherichia coli 2720900]|nr:hypothetical protein EC2720900_5326 [Escherichia coli 2720900]